MTKKGIQLWIQLFVHRKNWNWQNYRNQGHKFSHSMNPSGCHLNLIWGLEHTMPTEQMYACVYVLYIYYICYGQQLKKYCITAYFRIRKYANLLLFLGVYYLINVQYYLESTPPLAGFPLADSTTFSQDDRFRFFFSRRNWLGKICHFFSLLLLYIFFFFPYAINITGMLIDM